jgi:hypothetical protein
LLVVIEKAGPACAGGRTAMKACFGHRDCDLRAKDGCPRTLKQIDIAEDDVGDGGRAG